MTWQHRSLALAGWLLPASAAAALLACCGGSGPPEAPGLRFERAVVDVGEMISGSTRTVRFPFVVAQETVRIEELAPGCGCLEPRLEVGGGFRGRGGELAPGTRGEIVVEYDSTGFQGRKDTLVVVRGAGPGLPASLEVRSLLEPWLEIDPPRWTPGPLEGEGPWTVDFRVRGREPHRQLAALGAPAGVQVEGLPSAGEALEHPFRVTIPAGSDPGDQAWFLKLRADNGLSTILPFQYRIEEVVWTRPARILRLGLVPAGQEIHATVDLGTSRGELAVTEYRLEGLPGARVDCLNLTPSKTYRLRLVLPAGPSEKVLSGNLLLRLSHRVDGEEHILDRQIRLAGVVE